MLIQLEFYLPEVKLYFNQEIIINRTGRMIKFTYSYLKAHHLRFLIEWSIVVDLVAHSLPAGPGQSLYPLPHQDPGAFEPPQHRGGPELPLPHRRHTNAWHAQCMEPHSPCEARVCLRS